jgi:hypothetical protein
MLTSAPQGAGETLRGTLNSTVDRHFGANPRAMEKNQAAIDAGRYEVENRRFYHPNDVGQTADQHYTTASPQQEVPDSAGSGIGWSERASASSSRLGNFINKATGRPSSRVGADSDDGEPPRERMKLRKRSSSRLSVVGE